MTISNQLLCDLKQIAAEERIIGTKHVRVKTCPRVLVVEDTELDGELLMRFLSKRVCERVWVKSGEAAIEALSYGHQFDVMFLDLTLGAGPVQGVDVLRHVLANKTRVAVVVVSGCVPPELQGSLGCRMGVLRVIEKPATQKDIDEIFETHRFALE